MASTDWPNDDLRKKVRQNMEMVLKQSGIAKNPIELEQQMFEKSKNRDEYINCVRSVLKRANMQRSQNHMRPPMQPSNSMQQQNMNQQNMVPGNMNQPNMIAQQNMNPQTAGPQGINQPHMVNQNMPQQIMPAQNMNQQNMPAQNMNQPTMASQGANQQGSVPGIMQQNMNQQNIGMTQTMNQPQNSMMGPSHQQGMPQMRQLGRGNIMDHSSPMQPSPLGGGSITTFSPDRMQHPSPNNAMYTQRPSNMVRPQVPNIPQQAQLKTPESSYNNPPSGSHIPSLSPSGSHSVMSPALRTPQSVSMTQSPGNPMSNGPAPSPAQSQANAGGYDEKMYMEKLKQLQKYIEPLSRMINKEKHSKEVIKMKNLRDTLMDSKKRLPMATLLKCEKVLKNWVPVEKPSIIAKPQPDQHMCQPLLDAVAERRPQTMLNHTFKRTFGNALRMLNGGYTVPDDVCCKRIKLSDIAPPDEGQTSQTGAIVVPDLVQGEIARLNEKYLVTVDQSQSTANGHLHLICRLNNDSLPSVPPIHIVVPSDYPSTGVEWQKNGQMQNIFGENKSSEDKSTDELISHIDFLKRLDGVMDTQIKLALESSQSISSLLTAWEVSIRQSIAAV